MDTPISDALDCKSFPRGGSQKLLNARFDHAALLVVVERSPAFLNVADWCRDNCEARVLLDSP
eukprot:COSAG05_NODE_17851_length_318_cov_0.776256_1_plen_62_part_01